MRNAQFGNTYFNKSITKSSGNRSIMLNSTEQEVRAACDAELSRPRVNTTKAPDQTLDDIHAAITACADLPLERAQSLPAAAYTSQEFFDWEVENLFKAEWLSVGHVSQLPEIGDFLNLDLLGQPIIVIRDKSNEIRVLSRACPHRGMDIMPPGFGYDGHGVAERREGGTGCGKARLLLCPYHSWTFELDGSLVACPEMKQAEGFDRSDFELEPYRSEVWNGFIFVNLDGKAPKSIAEQYAEMDAHVRKWNLSEMSIVSAKEWDCPFNWKTLAENFIESYHHAGAHLKTLQKLMPARDTWTEEEKAHYIRCHLPWKPKVREQIDADIEAGGTGYVFPQVEGLTGEDRFEWGLYWGFPTFGFVVSPELCVWYRLEPLGPNKLKLLTTLLAPESTIQHPNFEQMRDEAEADAVKFHLEDMEVVTAVQRSMDSGVYKQGRLSHLEMPVWLIQRYLAARIRGTWPTMDRPPAPSQRPDAE